MFAILHENKLYNNRISFEFTLTLILYFSFQVHKSELEPLPPYGSLGSQTLPATTIGCYAGLDLPGLTGTSPPAQSITTNSTDNRDGNDNGHHRQLSSSSPRHHHLQQQNFSRQDTGGYPNTAETRGDYYSLMAMTSQPSSFPDHDSNHDLTLTDRQFSDKFLQIQQQQLLIQEKREQLKLLKEQRRRSLLQSPNSFLGKSDARASRDVHNTKADDTNATLYSKSQQSNFGNGDNYSSNTPEYDCRSNVFSDDRIKFNDTSDDLTDNTAGLMIPSQSYQNFPPPSPSVKQTTNNDLYVYGTLRPKKNVYSSIPDGNSELRTSTVVPSIARQNESVV